MSRLSQVFHRRSLTLAWIALLLSLLAGHHALAMAVHLSKSTTPPSSFFIIRLIALCVLAFVVSIHAVCNLIADVERGYSPNRCQLAAVVLFFAVPLSGWLMYQLIRLVLMPPA